LPQKKVEMSAEFNQSAGSQDEDRGDELSRFQKENCVV
jgi:hypothetical protein